MHMNQNDGRIEVICGPMFAGKTEELIRRIRRLEYAKQNIIVFKPRIDNRYSEDFVVSHNSSRTKSIAINSIKEIYKYICNDTQVVVIDEIQFFDKITVNICNSLANKGIRVIVSGLDMDFKGEPFSFMPELLSIAEHITKLTAICVKCGMPATRTQRLVDNKPANYTEPIVLVGASEVYEARCRYCHEVPGKVDYINE